MSDAAINNNTSVGNSDGSLEGWRGPTFCTMDFFNVVKNALNITGATFALATLPKALKTLSITSFGVGLISAGVGAAYIFSGCDGIYHAVKEYFSTYEDLASTRAIGEAYKKFQHHDQDFMTNRVQAVKEKVLLAYTNIYNWACYIGIGSTQLGVGIVSLLGPDTASLLQTTAVLTANVATKALTALLIGMGVIYIARGSIMLYRSYHSLNRVNSIMKEFDKLCKKFNETSENIPSTQNKLLNLLEKHLATDYCSLSLDGAISNEDFKQELQSIHEKLFAEKLQQEVARAIAVCMILGGALTLAAAFLTHGSSPLIIALVSSVVFTAVEGTFLLFDSPKHFDKYKHQCYSQPEWLKNKGTKIFDMPSETFKVYQEELSSWRPSTEAKGMRSYSTLDQALNMFCPLNLFEAYNTAEKAKSKKELEPKEPVVKQAMPKTEEALLFSWLMNSFKAFC